MQFEIQSRRGTSYRCSISEVIDQEVRDAKDFYSTGIEALQDRHRRLVELVGMLAEALPEEAQKEFVSKLHRWKVVE